MTTPDDARAQTHELERAVRWLREVDGRLMCKRDDPESAEGWVAIVRTPSGTGRRGQLILGFGDSALAAVETAQQSWDHAWRKISAVH